MFWPSIGNQGLSETMAWHGGGHQFDSLYQSKGSDFKQFWLLLQKGRQNVCCAKKSLVSSRSWKVIPQTLWWIDQHRGYWKCLFWACTDLSEYMCHTFTVRQASWSNLKDTDGYHFHKKVDTATGTSSLVQRYTRGWGWALRNFPNCALFLTSQQFFALQKTNPLAIELWRKTKKGRNAYEIYQLVSELQL